MYPERGGLSSYEIWKLDKEFSTVADLIILLSRSLNQITNLNNDAKESGRERGSLLDQKIIFYHQEAHYAVKLIGERTGYVLSRQENELLKFVTGSREPDPGMTAANQRIYREYVRKALALKKKLISLDPDV